MDGERDDQGLGRCPNCERLEGVIEQLTARIGQFSARIEKLEAALEEARRGGKRQAAPFRRKGRKADPKPPGRKPGDEYGEHARRAIPDEVDETYDVPLPDACPHCGGTCLVGGGVDEHYEIEIPRKPVTRRFDVAFGTCGDCGGSVRGRHPLQGSDSVGAAAVTLGPEAHATMALMNKRLGLSHGRIATFFSDVFGIRIARSTSCRSVLRTARRCEPAFGEVVESVRGSPTNVADETGWRIGGENAWLHVCMGVEATLVAIDRSRGADVLAAFLGWDWAGTLIHDGWAPYDRFESARHQQCLAHPLRRCAELFESAVRGAVRFPRAVKRLFQRALAVRYRWLAGDLTDHGVATLQGRLRAELLRLVTPRRQNLAHARLARHLGRHLDEWFAFLDDPTVDATNWRAEQAIRPLVVNRKVWGGNRTDDGAWAQSVLASVIATCTQRSAAALEYLANTLRAQSPLPLPVMGR